jgi:hypothetical protein
VVIDISQEAAASITFIIILKTYSKTSELLFIIYMSFIDADGRTGSLIGYGE